MKYKLANGQLVGEYQAFTYNNIQYPENWIALSTDEERQALGIQEYVEQPRPDDRFYFVTDNGDGTYSTTDKALEDGEQYVDLRGVARRVQGLKSLWVYNFKQTAGALLAASDWMIVRKYERKVAIPESVVTYRAAVIAEANRLESDVGAAASVEELIAVVNSQSWPVSE
jgi:hypothetical protein